MSILQDLVEGIVDKWNGSSPTVSIYLNHAPQGTAYPVLIFNVIDSPRTFAMGASGSDPHQYTRARVSFQCFSNENQMAELMDLAQEVEDCFSFQTLTLVGNVTSICTYMGDQRITFYDKQEKVWCITTDLFFMIGE